MKLLFIILFSFYSFLGIAQGNVNFKDYFSNNKIESFNSHFAYSVDISIPNTKSNFNKNQASILIQSFFKSEEINSYTSQHSGGGNGKAHFEIGKLITVKNKYRSYLLFTQKGDSFEIVEFRLEKE